GARNPAGQPDRPLCRAARQGQNLLPSPSRRHSGIAQGKATVMDFRLNPEETALREAVAEFAREQVAPVAADYYENGEFPYPLVSQLGEMGIFGAPFDDKYGGADGDYFLVCLALE